MAEEKEKARGARLPEGGREGLEDSTANPQGVSIGH
jgi:hypothetical protein